MRTTRDITEIFLIHSLIKICMEKRFTLKVIFGEQASSMAEDEGLDEACKAIMSGRLGGDVQEYTFSSAKDLQEAKRILDDASGWMENYYEDGE